MGIDLQNNEEDLKPLHTERTDLCGLRNANVCVASAWTVSTETVKVVNYWLTPPHHHHHPEWAESDFCPPVKNKLKVVGQITSPPSPDLKTARVPELINIINMYKTCSNPNWIHVLSSSSCPYKKLNLHGTLPMFCVALQDQCHLESTLCHAVSYTHTTTTTQHRLSVWHVCHFLDYRKRITGKKHAFQRRQRSWNMSNPAKAGGDQ